MDRRSKLAVRSVLPDEARPSVETPCPRANRTRLTVSRFIAAVADKFKHPTAVALKAYHRETGGVRTRILLSPDRSRKTFANVLMVREPGFAESKLRHGSSLGASRFGRTHRAGQGRSMWKARPMRTRSSSPSVGERYSIQKLHDDLFCDECHTGGTATASDN
jgi:hypothetical protein